MSEAVAPESLPTVESTGGTIEFPVMADGVRIRIARFPAPGGAAAGTVLMLPGFTEFIEKALETIGELRARGYGVITLDWRGQGLSDRLLANRRMGHIADMAHFLNDLEQVLTLTRFREQPGPLVLYGHSMGGHLALRAAHDHPGLFSRVILSAPMADIETGAWPRPVAYGLARTAVGVGFGKNYVPGTGPYSDKYRGFEGNPLTGDPVRFARIHAQIDANPDLALGGPSYQWFYSALRSIRLVNRKAYLSRITVPVLILSAGDEMVVSNAAQHEIASMLPDCRLVSFEGARHELLLERDELREKVWGEVDAFLIEGICPAD
ncbi:alpha/beta hydrolase [Nisaea acidiphila]|uniref:Alpha/beta hydrolase n=1 Tax=Nisaea acidiphila TaxID=1862145 RepID=A0A9J7AUR1_9PROT|nr:alpha/beta hydrolase [Nisaea acidiphila]UUX50554.1 alpha/beta hydrolase [Nisaea acidiphila]